MAVEAAKIEVFGVNGKYFLISGEEVLPGGAKHYMGDEGVLLRPKLEGAIDAPVKSLWLPGAFGQVFVDFRWQRRDMVFTVQTFDPLEDTPEGWAQVDSDWRFAFDYVKETLIRYTVPEDPDHPRDLWVRLLEEPKAYSSDAFEGKDPHLYNTGSVVMTVAAELPFYQGITNEYTWVPEPEGTFNAVVDFSTMPNGPMPSSFTKISDYGLGGVQVVNGKLMWVESGVGQGAEFWLYNVDEAESDFFEVVTTLPDPNEWGLFQGDLQLIGRCDGTLNNYVFCDVRYQPPLLSSVQVGAVIDGVLHRFELPAGIGLNPNDVVSFGATGLNTYRVKVNGITVHVINAGGVHTGAGYRKVGLRIEAGGDFIGGQVIPATISKFEARDILTSDERSYTFTVENRGDVPVWPRWTLTDKANWTLPDYSFGNEEFGRPVEDAARTVPLPYLPEGAGCVADADPRRQTLLAANHIHLQGLWGGKDLLYPIPHGTHEITVTVKDASDGFALMLEVPQWHTRPWG
jgi:hypothetical protein